MSAAAVRARGRAAKRLESALAREALALKAAVKAQKQRDELVSELEVAHQTIESLHGSVERLSEEVGELKKACAGDVPAVPRSPPAKGGLPKVRPDESDDSDEPVRVDRA